MTMWSFLSKKFSHNFKLNKKCVIIQVILLLNKLKGVYYERLYEHR